jgi:hypothetical protein
MILAGFYTNNFTVNFPPVILLMNFKVYKDNFVVVLHVNRLSVEVTYEE